MCLNEGMPCEVSLSLLGLPHPLFLKGREEGGPQSWPGIAQLIWFPAMSEDDPSPSI